MEEVKRRVLALIDADQVRQRGHFKREADADRVTVDDALRVLRRGACVPGGADIDVTYGERHLFRGTDTKDRLLEVVVSIDEPLNVLWLHTVYLPQRRKLRR